MGQIDTFDPKAPAANKGTPKKAGSLYDVDPDGGAAASASASTWRRPPP